MKKYLSIIFLIVFYPNISFAETMEDLLNDNYKITEEKIVKFERHAHKIFTLKKKKSVKLCSVKIYKSSGLSSRSQCMTP